MPRVALSDAEKRLRGTFNNQYSEAARASGRIYRGPSSRAVPPEPEPPPRPSRALPELRDDPWFYLGLKEGDARLRRWKEREDQRAARAKHGAVRGPV